MGLGMWFRDEILNALLAAEEVCRSTVAALGDGSDYTRGYEEGFMAALSTLATAFGIRSRVGRERLHRPVVRVQVPQEFKGTLKVLEGGGR
ncbi:MAG: hypothetical protein DRI61_06490 [Chloroflexi bacterium]|nr:MAG: hypothetical protein DRI61_06490 [Chloroflexota bacterium]HDN78848.1 hypothetical protein [Chloroflexota bacterium]